MLKYWIRQLTKVLDETWKTNIDRKEGIIMATEKLCLKWNDFQNIVETSFSELRSSCDFTDVTLACEDQSIGAHKLILSACSKRLLKAHPNPQPFIYMRGLRYCDLEAAVDFIHRGETNIDQEQLEKFLQIADELKLQGLTRGSRERGGKIGEGMPRDYSDHWQKRDVVKAETKTTEALAKDRWPMWMLCSLSWSHEKYKPHQLLTLIRWQLLSPWSRNVSTSGLAPDVTSNPTGSVMRKSTLRSTSRVWNILAINAKKFSGRLCVWENIGARTYARINNFFLLQNQSQPSLPSQLVEK